MKKTILALCTLALAHWGTAYAQDATPETKSKWTIKGITGLNLSQTSLTNWSAGGENNVAWNLYLNASANYKKEKFSWDNSLIADFGNTYMASQSWQKSVDKLNLSSKAGYAISKNWNVAALADFLTQFAYGYKDADGKDAGNHISNFMAPAYLTVSLGFDYKPNDSFSAYLSPVAGKLTFVADKHLSNQGLFGVKPGEQLVAELGTTAVFNYHKEIMQNVKLVTKLTLFSSYTNNFGNIDVNWDMALAFKINKFLNATLTTNLIYDDDVMAVDSSGQHTSPKVQFREIIGLGVAYSF